jgi:mono/diheme cytochrome c family protein
MYGVSRLVIATMALVGTFVVVLLTAAQEPARMERYAANFHGREIEVGADLYFQACATCHGQHGEGLVGPALNSADLLVPAPGETRPPRLIAKNYVGDLRSYLEGTITYGRPGTVMPAWGQAAGGPFRPDQVSALATFIMNWGLDPGKQWGGAPERVAIGGVEPVPVVGAMPMATPPPRDVRSADLGKYLFNGPAGCAECHTFDIATGKTGPDLTNIVQNKGRDYVRNSIVNPNGMVAPDHAPGIMPQTFAFALTDIELESIIDYLENPAAATLTVAATPTPTGPLDGKQVAQNAGCFACHSVDGSAMVGPTWQGLFGHEVELEDGSKVIADEAYLLESIVKPGAKIVKGYQNLMPANYEQLLTPEQITAIIEYIKLLH